MKKIFGMTLCFAVLTSARAYPQNGETTLKQGYGYALFTPGATVGDGGAAATLTIGVGGVRLIKGGFAPVWMCRICSIQRVALAKASGCFLPVCFTSSIPPANRPLCHGWIFACLPRWNDEPDPLWRGV